MVEVALGALAATTASVLFSSGLVLQSLEARTIPSEHSLRLSLIRRLLRRRRWIEGCLIMVTGFGFHVGALILAPLSVVQPSLTAGLVVLLIAGARHDAAPLRAREGLAVVAIALGVVGVTLTASQSTALSTSAGSLVVALAPLAAAAIAPYALVLWAAAPGAVSGIAATLGAGAAYALTGLTTKLVSDAVASGRWLGVVLWLMMTACSAGLALLNQTTALQRRAAAQVGAVIYVTPVVVPVLLAGLLLGARWPSSAAGAVVLGLAMGSICAGASFLSASREVIT
ncbi:MAG: hypothetical protein M3Z27_06100 [Actinomycetota bacterium]|nr:hypothetical protein [Actinomycetota bacterium]